MFPNNRSERILLIEPPFFKLFGYKRWHYPITLTLVGTYLEELGHDVVIYDGDRPDVDCNEYNRSDAAENYFRYGLTLDDPNHPAWDEILQVIRETKPDGIGIAASITAKIDSANRIAAMIKSQYDDSVPIILGGSHVGAMLSMQPDYEFDSIYDGVYNDIPGLIDRKPNKKLLLDYDRYEPQNFCSIMSSSGCPNACTFCTYSTDRKTIYRNVPSIRAELEEIYEANGAEHPIYFVDDSFLSNTKRFYEITGAIKELGMRFRAGGRLMNLSKEKIEKFIENGGLQIYVGIESGSQRVLDRIRKRLKLEQIRERTKWLNEAGLPWSAFFIVGFPFETIEDLRMTKELILEIEPTFVSINRFAPYPGTEIYREFYKDRHPPFKEIFQLNAKIHHESNTQIDNYIESLFDFADRYNAEKNR